MKHSLPINEAKPNLSVVEIFSRASSKGVECSVLSTSPDVNPVQYKDEASTSPFQVHLEQAENKPPQSITPPGADFKPNKSSQSPFLCAINDRSACVAPPRGGGGGGSRLQVRMNKTSKLRLEHSPKLASPKLKRRKMNVSLSSDDDDVTAATTTTKTRRGGGGARDKQKRSSKARRSIADEKNRKKTSAVAAGDKPSRKGFRGLINRILK